MKRQLLQTIRGFNKLIKAPLNERIHTEKFGKHTQVYNERPIEAYL